MSRKYQFDYKVVNLTKERNLLAKPLSRAGESTPMWIAINCIDYYNKLLKLWPPCQEVLNTLRIPMRIKKFEFLWKDDDEYPEATSLSSFEYVRLCFKMIKMTIQDTSVFVEVEPFPKKFKGVVKDLFKKMFRIYGHFLTEKAIYDQLIQFKMGALCSTIFENFIKFVFAHRLMKSRDIAPMNEWIIDNLDEADYEDKLLIEKPRKKRKHRKHKKGHHRRRKHRHKHHKKRKEEDGEGEGEGDADAQEEGAAEPEEPEKAPPAGEGEPADEKPADGDEKPAAEGAEAGGDADALHVLTGTVRVRGPFSRKQMMEAAKAKDDDSGDELVEAEGKEAEGEGPKEGAEDGPKEGEDGAKEGAEDAPKEGAEDAPKESAEDAPKESAEPAAPAEGEGDAKEGGGDAPAAEGEGGADA